MNRRLTAEKISAMTIESSLSQLRYLLLPSANPPPELLELHDKTFLLWREVWTETLAKLEFKSENLAEEFVRQDIVACIASGNEPVAIHLYSFFATDSLAARKHGYLSSNYPELFFAKLAKEKVRHVMSMEYMTVHPEWRKHKAALHVASALGGLGLRVAGHFGAQATIAPCRRDHKIHEMAYLHGGEPVIANVLNHNVPCDLVMVRMDKAKAHPDPELSGLVDRLWNSRDYRPGLREEQARALAA